MAVVPQDEQGLLDIADLLATPTRRRCSTPAGRSRCCGDGGAPRRRPGLHPGAVQREEPGPRHRGRRLPAGLQRSGITVDVDPDTTVFDAIRAAARVAVLGSCLEGICGTCETAVLEGEVDHRDSVLDADEQEASDCMMVCVSRCRGDRLVLDL
ncbi:MAG: 2Fe-2S iron-sulfur cluster binding domain-containing protein [Nocardioides sp.]